VAIVGASGAGKSTVVDLILQLYLPSSGKIMVDGVDLAGLDIKDWRRSIGVVDQDVFLLNASIEENISFGRRDKNFDSIRSAAKVAHADEFVKNLRDGYHTIVGDRGHKLSGGEQQRLALARAVLREPDILILDEATSALDTVSERLIQRAIEDMHKKATIVVIAHRLATVVNADKIIVLDNGRVVEFGTKDELLIKDDHFAKLWKMQTGRL
jgi:ABC-type multidrug transport system fused ATPase/permease subunit